MEDKEPSDRRAVDGKVHEDPRGRHWGTCAELVTAKVLFRQRQTAGRAWPSINTDIM